jgi:hypothetical protein
MEARMPEGSRNQDREIERLETELGQRLRAELQPPAAEPPARVDDAVAAVIRLRSAEVRRALAARRRRYWPAWAAAAALVLAAGGWGLFSLHRAPRRPGDIDGSGTVDIVDAYLLSRQLGPAGRIEPAWDVNRDGRVDRADIDAVARIAVAVGPGGR